MAAGAGKHSDGATEEQASGREGATTPRLSATGAFWLLMKSCLGVGALGLPHAARDVKLTVGISMLFFSTILNLLATYWLVECAIKVRYGSAGRVPRRGACSSSDGVAFLQEAGCAGSAASAKEQSQSSKPEGCAPFALPPAQLPPADRCPDNWGLGPFGDIAWAVMGKPGLVVAALLTVCGTLGVCCAFLDVIFATLDDRIAQNSSETPMALRVGVYIFFCALVNMKQLKELACVSAVGCVVYLYIAGDLMYRGSQTISEAPMFVNEASPWGPANWDGLAECFGRTVYAFEDLYIAQFIFRDMQLGNQAGPFYRVTGLTYALTFLILGFLEVYGYMAYRGNVAEVIFLNFPYDATDTIVCELVVVLVIIVTYLLNAFVVFEFLGNWLGIDTKEPPVLDCSDSEDEGQGGGQRVWYSRQWNHFADLLMRCTVVAVTFAVAIALPDVGKITALVGSICFGLYGFVLPAVFYQCLFLKEMGLVMRLTCVMVTLLGLATTVNGAYGAISA